MHRDAIPPRSDNIWSPRCFTWPDCGRLDLSGLTLGVVGVGNVGSKVAHAAEALGMKVLLNDPPRARAEGEKGFVGLDEILEKSDVVTLHVPLNRGGEDNTFQLVDDRFIERLKQGAVLVNTSRGRCG